MNYKVVDGRETDGRPTLGLAESEEKEAASAA
jgi:hypothetical protein